MQIKKLGQIIERVSGLTKRPRLAVAAAADEDVLKAVFDAQRLGVAALTLIGNVAEISDILSANALQRADEIIIDQPDPAKAADIATGLVARGEADFIMKGHVDTPVILKAVLKEEHGLRTGGLLSHVMVYENKLYDRLLILTDGGMNIAPSLEEKKKIAENAAECARSLGLSEIKIAAIAANEKVSDKMPATIHAAQLQQACEKGEFSEGIVLEGPLAVDIAVSKHAAKTKKYPGKIGGESDILLVPAIEVGNAVGKALTYLAGSKSAGIVMGAKIPIVLASRADSAEAKLYSIALAALVASGSKY